MIDLNTIVRRASLAPSVHNVQGTRWRASEKAIELTWDDRVSLTVGDPERRDAGLSFGAALEATVLALSEAGFGADVKEGWAPGAGPDIRGAIITPVDGGVADPLAPLLEQRFTWRGAFAAGAPQLDGWNRDDLSLVVDHPTKAWIAKENDAASLRILQDKPFRQELLSWMRLSRWHGRRAYDGLSRDALGLSRIEALGAKLALGPLWGLFDRLGLTAGLTAEAEKTQSAQAIAVIHRPAGESPVVTGRHYLRIWLEATRLGYAGWPMASLSDDADSRAAVADRLNIPASRRIIQVMRLGKPSGPMPPRARRPLDELLA